MKLIEKLQKKGKHRYAHHGCDGHGQNFAHPPDENPRTPRHAAHSCGRHAGKRLKVFEKPADDGAERKEEQLGDEPFLCSGSHNNLQNSQMDGRGPA